MGAADDRSATARPEAIVLGAFLAVALLGGLNAIAVKATVQEIEPLWGAAARFLLAGAVLLVALRPLGRSLPTGTSGIGAVVYGLLGFGASYGLIYPALREVPAATTMVFIALVPLETFILAVVHRLERFRAQGLVGAIVSAAGVLVVVSDQLGAAVPLGSMLMVLLGTLFIAESAIVVKWVPKADPWGSNAVAMTAGGLALLGISAVLGETWAVPALPSTWAATAYLVLLGSIALFGLYLFGIRRWTASGMSYSTLLMPLVTLPVAAALFGEPITLPFLAGGAIAVGGTYLGAFMPARPRRSTATSAPECLPIDDCPELPPSGSPVAREAV